MLMKSVVHIIMAGMILFAVPAFAQTESSADTNMEILMQKVKADKKLLVAANMELTDAEIKGFWPLYDAYQKDLQQMNERLGKMINAYADAYNQGKGSIPNDTAKKLLNEVISIEEQEVKLKRSYADKVGKVLPAAKTARYIQIENKIRAVIKFELARQIPLVY
jgi:Spy/CpxP family protein refolding chaperone